MRPRQRHAELLALGAAAMTSSTSSISNTPSSSSSNGNNQPPSRRRRLASSATMATVTALAGLLLLLPAHGFMGPARSPLLSTRSRSSNSRGVVSVGAGRNEEWETNNGEQRERDNPWATQQPQQQQGASDNDWYMTGRIHYLREMEKLGQELHDLMDATGETGTAGGINGMILNGPGAAGVVPEAGPGGAGMAAAALSEAEKAAREAASQEELRRQEVLVAESCALNWREEPVFAKPVGFVPGNRKVQQVRLCDSRVMYGSDGGFVGLASVADGRDIFRLQAHSALVTALDYDAATGWALSAADDGLVHVYRETPEGRVEQVHGPGGLRLHSNRVVAAEVLDHRWGLTASMDGKILIFELDSGAVVQELWASDTLLALSVCKGYVFVGLMSGVCEAFSIRNGGRSAFRYIAQRTPIRSLRTFPLAGNQIKVVAGGQDGAIRQFHVRPVHAHSTTGEQAMVWKVPQDRSFDDRLVLLCNTHVDQEVLAPDRERADQGFLLKGHKAPVVAVACDETKVVSASEDGTVIVWDAQKGAAAYTIRQHVDGDLVAAVDFNERYLVVDGTRGKCFVFDYAVGKPPRKASGPLSSSGRPSRKGASSSRRGSGPKPNRNSGPQSRRGNGEPSGQQQQPPQQQPPQFPQAPFPFIGGWNLGHGPTDNVSGMNTGNGAMGESEGGAAEGGVAGPGEDED